MRRLLEDQSWHSYVARDFFSAVPDTVWPSRRSWRRVPSGRGVQRGSSYTCTLSLSESPCGIARAARHPRPTLASLRITAQNAL